MLPNDPIMLMSVVNTKLRDIYPSLERLCDDLDISEKELTDSHITMVVGVDVHSL